MQFSSAVNSVTVMKQDDITCVFTDRAASVGFWMSMFGVWCNIM